MNIALLETILSCLRARLDSECTLEAYDNQLMIYVGNLPDPVVIPESLDDTGAHLAGNYIVIPL
jgi:hypothetical protein